MWLKDTGGNYTNTDTLMALDIVPDSNNSGYYVVQGNNSINSAVTHYWTGNPMTEAEAEDLRVKIVTMLGTFDFTV